MEKPPFFRTALDGQRVPVSWEEIHKVRREILHYYENNLTESTNVLIAPENASIEYARYLSVSYEDEYAESERYAWLCERGCLALLNGMSLEVLTDQLWKGSDLWEMGKELAQLSLPYLQSYSPTEESLEVGREFLISTFNFLIAMDIEDLNEDGYLQFPIEVQAPWFTKNIIGDYFRSTAELKF